MTASIYDLLPTDLAATLGPPAAGPLPLAPDLTGLHTAWQHAAEADRAAGHTYIRAEAETRRACRAYAAGTLPRAALRSARAAQDTAWDRWTTAAAAASRAWWAWQTAFSAWDRATLAGLTPILPEMPALHMEVA